MGLKSTLLLGALVAALGLAGGAQAAGTPCGSTPGLLCSDVIVPLDRTGVVPGTVDLHVEDLPPVIGPSRGTVFLIAGGPGQGSARTFDLGSAGSASLFRLLFPGYTLVAYDDRGTGASGLLDCPALQTSTAPTGEDLLAASCAATIGPAAGLYGTADHVEDLDAVRASLGLDKIALFGVSYGTKLALAYAAAHPTHVDRMVLDSVLPTSLPDPFEANVTRAMPATLAAYCANVCRAATPDFAGDVVTVANRIAAKPVHGTVLLASGAKKAETMTGVEVLSLVVDADLNPGLAAELPAAFHAARLGNVAPLLRLHVFDLQASVLAAADLSAGLYAATDCRDGPFPWPADSAPSARPALLQGAIAALPAGTFGPFGTWASDLGNASLCDTWPSPSGGVNLSPNSMPNVPVLALSGGFDMRTPTAGAQSVIAQFPQGKLVVVPGVGHSVVTADPSGCAALAVRDWIMDPTSNDTCTRAPFLVAPIAAFPPAVPAGHRASPKTTFTIASRTIAEAEAAWLIGSFDASNAPIPGVTSGTLLPANSSMKLNAYGIVAGVTVSGTLKLSDRKGVTLAFQGRIAVGGRSAARGTLQVQAAGVGGTLGGKPVP